MLGNIKLRYIKTFYNVNRSQNQFVFTANFVISENGYQNFAIIEMKLTLARSLSLLLSRPRLLHTRQVDDTYDDTCQAGQLLGGWLRHARAWEIGIVEDVRAEESLLSAGACSTLVNSDT